MASTQSITRFSTQEKINYLNMNPLSLQIMKGLLEKFKQRKILFIIENISNGQAHQSVV